MATTADLRIKQEAESSFVRAALDVGAVIVPGHALFLPGRAVSDSEILRTLRSHNIDAVLFLKDGPSAAPRTTTSTSGKASCSTSWAGTACDATSETSTSSRQNEFTLFSEVVDVASDELTWTATTHLTRIAATNDQLLAKFAKDVVERLVAGGVLAVHPPQ